MNSESDQSKKRQRDIVSSVSLGATYFWDDSDLQNAILCFYQDNDQERFNEFIKLLLENPGIQNVRPQKMQSNETIDQVFDKYPLLHHLAPIICDLRSLDNGNCPQNPTQTMCSTLASFSTSKCLLEETFAFFNRVDASSKLDEISNLKYFLDPSSCIKAIYALKLYQCYQSSHTSATEAYGLTLIEKLFRMSEICSESEIISQVLLLVTLSPIIRKHIHDPSHIPIHIEKSYDLVSNLYGGEKEAMMSYVELLCAHIKKHQEFVQRIPVSLLVTVGKMHFPLAKTIVECLIENCTKGCRRSKDILVEMCRFSCDINQLCQDLIENGMGTK
jgi:hypothetical protein